MKRILGNILRFLFDRQTLVRGARFVLNEARLDFANGIWSNGESDLQKSVLLFFEERPVINVFDIGANKGEWSIELLRNASELEITSAIKLRCFEPSLYTYNLLCKNLSPYQDIVIENLAVSDMAGEEVFFIVGDGLGVNSFHKSTPESCTEIVKKTTIHDYSKQHGIDHIEFIKIDTEGHDWNVLCGGLELIKNRKVDFVQFEYNSKWILSRHFLRDVFELVEDQDYLIGKITKFGIEVYSTWDVSLETFVEGNYLVFNRGYLKEMKVIEWWNRAKSRSFS